MKVIQINTSVNSGSTGRIAEDIGKLMIAMGHKSWIAYGRGNQASVSRLIRIGGKWDMVWHGVITRLFDRHGFGSGAATRNLIARIREIKPDLIHLHNIHGYYLNIRILFDYLRYVGRPVVWTLHDCWPFTGHCTYFDAVDCRKWESGCFDCPNKRAYPQSWWKDNSKENFLNKKRLFTSLRDMVIVTPSRWLGNHVSRSFLSEFPVEVIHNGIDLGVFKASPAEGVKRKYGLGGRKVILGVAGVWQRRKGLDDFIRLHETKIPGSVIVLVGLTPRQIKKLPSGMIGIARTENLEELVALYSAADVFVNPTYVDNFPTTNIEALACGTPVITYDTGGSSEAIGANTGKAVPKGCMGGLISAVKEVLENGKDAYSRKCRKRAERLFDSRRRYQDYFELYMKLIGKKAIEP